MGCEAEATCIYTLTLIIKLSQELLYVSQVDRNNGI